MERKLIHQNDELLTDICNDLQKLKPALTKLKSAYDALELKEEFTDSIYKELITKGASRISNQYRDELNAQLDRSGITNTNLRAVALSGSEAPLKLLEASLRDLKEVNLIPSYAANPRHQTLSLMQVSYLNDVFTVTDLDRESIAEMYCRVYLETEEDYKTYNVLLDLQKALAAYEALKAEKELPKHSFSHYGQYISDFFSQSGVLQPGSVRWINGYKARREAANRR